MICLKILPVLILSLCSIALQSAPKGAMAFLGGSWSGLAKFEKGKSRGKTSQWKLELPNHKFSELTGQTS